MEPGIIFGTELANVVNVTDLGDQPSTKFISWVVWEASNAAVTPPPTFYVSSPVAFTFRMAVTVGGGTTVNFIFKKIIA